MPIAYTVDSPARPVTRHSSNKWRNSPPPSPFPLSRTNLTRALLSKWETSFTNVVDVGSRFSSCSWIRLSHSPPLPHSAQAPTIPISLSESSWSKRVWPPSNYCTAFPRPMEATFLRGKRPKKRVVGLRMALLFTLFPSFTINLCTCPYWLTCQLYLSIILTLNKQN